MIDATDARQLAGQTLTTDDGKKVGKIGQVYLDDYDNQPQWVTVHTGLFGLNESFVPLAQAQLRADGLRVPYSKDTITNAPNIDDTRHLSEQEVRDLYDYYSITYDDRSGSTERDSSTTGTTGTTTAYTGSAGTDAAYAEGTRAEDYSTGSNLSDDAMTRSEERLDVGTEKVQRGTARLRKWVETEHVQVDVPVKKEKARLVTEPITDENRGDAVSGADISEDEHVVQLSEERPVVSKETVPTERVRLEKDVVEDTETVSDDVRKEHIDFEGDDGTTDRR